MKIIKKLKNIDVVILCGGLGKRLRPAVKNKPKALAKIGEKAFLDILIGMVLSHGLKRIILSVGYLKEQIMEHYVSRRDCDIVFSEENVPLGTGGAVKKTKNLLKGDSLLVMNGDSICDVDLNEFYRFHDKNNNMLSMLVVKSRMDSEQDKGVVEINELNRVVAFREKAKVSKENFFVSGGMYFMRNDIFSHMPAANNFSLEYDFFPKILDKGVYGFLCDNEVIDIGTPERYENVRGGLYRG